MCLGQTFIAICGCPYPNSGVGALLTFSHTGLAEKSIQVRFTDMGHVYNMTGQILTGSTGVVVRVPSFLLSIAGSPARLA